MAPRGNNNRNAMLCKRCSKDVTFYVICSECNTSFHPSCVLKISGTYVDSDGKILCCKNITSKISECQQKDEEILKLKKRLAMLNESIYEKSVMEQSRKDGVSDSVLTDNLDVSSSINHNVEYDNDVEETSETSKSEILTNENNTLKKLIYHLEKRTAEQEQLIELLKQNKHQQTETTATSTQKKTNTYRDVVVARKEIGTEKSINENRVNETESKELKVSDNKQTTEQKNYYTKRKYISKPVIGKNKSTIKTLEKKGHLHIYRLDSQTTTDELLQYLNKAAPDIPFQCELLKKTDDRASFRVSFPFEFLDRAYEPDLWPAGAAIRRFVFRKPGNFRQESATAMDQS